MRLHLVAASALLSASAIAGQTPDLTTFTPGTPAKASEVNANFEAIKNAVNDNDSRITTLGSQVDAVDSRLTTVESGKQNRITGACEPGMAVVAVAQDGSVSCEAYRPASGAVAIWHDGFRQETNPNCSYVSETSLSMPHAEQAYFLGLEHRKCAAHAQIQLPDAATITGFSCRVRDVSDTGAMYAELIRHEIASFSMREYLASAGKTQGAFAGAPELLGANVYPHNTFNIVDNSRYIYRLWIAFEANVDPAIYPGFDYVRDKLRLYGCTVTYVQ